MYSAAEHFGKQLGVSPKKMLEFEKMLESMSKESLVFERLKVENHEFVERFIKDMGIKKYDPNHINSAIRQRLLKADDRLRRKFRGNMQRLMDFSIRSFGLGKVLSLKSSKARELLRQYPPENLLRLLKYKSVEKLIKKHDIDEIFCSLRFIESNEWMHRFFRSYVSLKADDFVERPIKFLVLSKKLHRLAKRFIKKKFHNTSHMKELGLAFMIPEKMRKGEFLKSYSILVQYLFEVKFYSDMIKKYSRYSNFGRKLTFLLRGDILNKKLPRSILIVQRYLYKENPNDWRLNIPHVNPEVLHWKRAEEAIDKISDRFNLGLEPFHGMNWVGHFFDHKFVSFDFADNIVGATDGKMYSYHLHENLWFKIIEDYSGDKLEKTLVDTFDKGYIKL